MSTGRRAFFEKRTGILTGTYRFVESDRNGPPPVIGFVLRPPNPGWVRLEVVILGRAFYVTWGYET